jgi:filamentous hemagglutinin family protein
MTQSDRTWKLRLAAGLVISGIFVAKSGNYAFAQSQIVPDNTLGAESSQVIPNAGGLPVEVIDGGAQRGANLFHSFREFNVDEGRGAYFINPSGIENILSRVTGSNVSNIGGLLGVLGNANLFLINPNGIIFGQNASLDVQGSFVATTANAVQFGDRGFFSATNPQSPTLLTINPSAFLFNQIALAQQPSITVNSNRLTGFDRSGNPVFEGLSVPDGQSLLLVGGEILVDGGKLFAPGGRVELAGVGGTGAVKLNINDNLLNLDLPESIAGANISLTNGAKVNVRAGDRGDITINAQNLTLDRGSSLEAGIDRSMGSANVQAGNIEIKAKDDVTISNGSFIANLILRENIGNAGNVNRLVRKLATGSEPCLE